MSLALIHHALEDGVEELTGLLRVTVSQQFHRALEVSEQQDAPVQMILDKLASGLLPRQDASKTFGGYGTGAPCAGCDLAIRPIEVEYELVFADGRAYAFHIACATLWRTLKAPDGGEWRVTCGCKVLVGFADTLAAAEDLGREHVADRKGRHVITLARQTT